MALCKSAYINSNIRYKSLSLSALYTLFNFMILSCLNYDKNMISRYVRCASVECWNASNIFLRARI